MSGLWSDITSIGTQIFQAIPGLQSSAKEVQTIIVKEVDRVTMTRSFVRISGLSGGLAVALAAYGSHGTFPDEKTKKTFEIGNKMHMMHSIALLASPMANRPILVGSLFSMGMLLFSGSCYVHALTGNAKVRQVTPYGGMMLIFGWLAVIL